jgi:nickel-dependent lactate racemase
MKKLVGGNIYENIRCIDGDSSDFVHMGTTKLGTPVDITRIVAEADRRIGVGNIEYHYFAGYSGGAKAIMPGVSTRAAIQSNHSRMVLPEAAAGRLEGNPVREDIEEALVFCPLDFIVNVVLDEHKEIICAVAGHAVKAHRAGCVFLDRLYRKEIDARADIVIASQGGAPKDLNLYQTQKALDNAKHAVKPGGIIILAGSCKEGLGEEVFRKWMTESESPKAMVERIQKDFQLGGHKAAAIGLVLADADIYLVSEMAPDFVKQIFLKPYPTVQSALDAAFKKLGENASVLVMPYGGSTLPVAKQ